MMNPDGSRATLFRKRIFGNRLNRDADWKHRARQTSFCRHPRSFGMKNARGDGTGRQVIQRRAVIEPEAALREPLPAI